MSMHYYSFRRDGGSGGMFGQTLFPPVIRGLLLTNFAVYLLVNFIGPVIIPGLQSFINEYFALQYIGSGKFLPWQLVSYQFLHGGFSHIFFNMLLFWLFGRELEHHWGAKRFLTFYLLSGVGAGIVHIALGPIMGFDHSVFDGQEIYGYTIGASGAVYGVMTAFGFSFPTRTLIMFPIPIPMPAKYFVLMLGALALIEGLSRSGGNVAHFAHLGGAVVGYLLLRYGDEWGIYKFFDSITAGFKSGRKIQPIERSRKANVFEIDVERKERRETPSWFKTEDPSTKPAEKRVISQEEVDMLLDKIARSGYNSLTDKEKRLLEEASKNI